MNHEEATRIEACSRYLMGELAPAEAEAFEEHFFSCVQCAEELTTGAVFAENVRAVFRDQARGLAAVVSQAEPRTGLGWLQRFGPAMVLLPCAMAACALLVVGYQNLYQIPGLKREIGGFREPQALPHVALKLAREPGQVQIQPVGQFWNATFLLPKVSDSSYICEIQRVGSGTVKTVTLPAPPLGHSFSILLSRAEFPSGSYLFRIRGRNSSTVTDYTIDIKVD